MSQKRAASFVPSRARRSALLAALGVVVLCGLAAPVAAGQGPCDVVEVEGLIEALPEGGLVGDWVVDGVVVHVTAETQIVSDGPVAVGAAAEVRGCADGDAVTAKVVKVEASAPACEEAELEGAVEALPEGGLIGDWIVAGVVIHVSEETKIAGKGDLAIGVMVEVTGCADGEAITATWVKVDDGDDEGDEAELRGPVESLPADGLVGDWVVAGVVVHVAAETAIDQSDGDVAIGVVVEVEGVLLEDGSIQALKIEVEGGPEGDGAGGHPDATSFAVLHLLPTAAAPEAEGVALTRLFVRDDGSQDEDLKVAVEHLSPDAVFDVVVDGFAAGSIHVNAEGEGCLFLSSRDIPAAEPLPSELRPVTGLGIVEVVDPAGVVVLTGDFADARRHDRTHPGTEFVAVALLRDAAGAVVGVVVATAEDGEQELTVKAWNLEPSTDFVVVLDASELTTLTSDVEGMLEAEFTDSPDADEMLLPAEFLPVSALLHAELQTATGEVVAAGDFGVVAEAAVATGAGTARRRGGHH